MAWFDRINPFAARKTDDLVLVEKAAPGASLFELVTEILQSSDSSSPVRSYMDNVVVHRCVREFAHAVSSVEWSVRQGDKYVEDERIDLVRLVNRPHPAFGTAEWMGQAATSYAFHGELLMRANSTSNPGALEILDPPQVKVEMKNGRLKYTVNPGSRTYSEEHIGHIKTPNPYDGLRGLPPYKPANFSIKVWQAGCEWNHNLLKNNARPSGALIYKPKDGLPQVLSAEQVARLKTQLAEHSGKENAGKALLLDGGLEWQSFGLSPDDMDFVESKNSAARDIAQAFGVPPVLLGIGGDSTFNNFKEARVAFWEQTIIPFLSVLRDEFNRWLTPMFEGDYAVEYSLEEIPALAIKQQKQYDMAERASFLTINEKRSMTNWPSMGPEGDILQGFAVKDEPAEPKEEEAEETEEPKEEPTTGSQDGGGTG